MREQFIASFLSRISDRFSDDDLRLIHDELVLHSDGYDISIKTTDLVPYDPVPQCVKAYLVSRKIEGVKQSSLKLYGLRLGQFFRMVRIPIDRITANDVRVFLYNIQEESTVKRGHRMSDRTLDGIRTVVCSFFRWASSEGYIQTNPCGNLKPIRYNKRERQSLTEEELELLRCSCSTLRDQAIIETLYSTGCRVSELTALKRSDVDLKTCEVTLFGKGEKYRQAYLNPKAMISLIRYLNSRTDDSPYLFVNSKNCKDMQLTKSGIEYIIRRIAESAGIKRRVYPHLIRHTTACIGLQRGMDITEIQRMLGHTSIATTMIYAKVSSDAVKQHHSKCIV